MGSRASGRMCVLCVGGLGASERGVLWTGDDPGGAPRPRRAGARVCACRGQRMDGGADVVFG